MSKFNPGRRLVSVTPSDSAVVSPPYRSFMVAAAGNVSVVAADDTTPVTVYVAAGVPIPIEVKQVRATGTTATGIVGIY